MAGLYSGQDKERRGHTLNRRGGAGQGDAGETHQGATGNQARHKQVAETEGRE